MKKIKKINKKHRDELLNAIILASSNKRLLDTFLHDLLTFIEYQDLVYRWQIVQRLANGEAQRSIAEDLDLGIATVTRGSRELADPNGGFNQILRAQV